MSGDLALWLLLFAGSAIPLVFSGVFLVKYGDALAELMGWSRLWVGTILIAVATSLLELVTTVTAAIREEPELAGGAILGANMVNMFAMAMVALAYGGGSFFRQVAPELRFLAMIAISLTALAILLGAFSPGVSVLKIGLGSVLILALYLGGIGLVYLRRLKEPARAGGDPAQVLPSLRKTWALFAMASFGVLLAAPAMTFSVEQIAEETGLATSFLGVVMVALVSTTPELSTTIAAVRFRAVDLAIGNLYGSCAFNILILALADPFYRQGTLVDTLESAHLAAGLGAIVLMGLGLSQIMLRGSHHRLPVVPTLVTMGLIYLGSLYAVYSLG